MYVLTTVGLFADFNAQIHFIRNVWEKIIGPEGTGHLTDVT